MAVRALIIAVENYPNGGGAAAWPRPCRVRCRPASGFKELAAEEVEAAKSGTRRNAAHLLLRAGAARRIRCDEQAIFGTLCSP